MQMLVYRLSAVEGRGASGANGVAPLAGQDQEPDPDWQPL